MIYFPVLLKSFRDALMLSIVRLGAAALVVAWNETPVYARDGKDLDLSAFNSRQAWASSGL